MELELSRREFLTQTASLVVAFSLPVDLQAQSIPALRAAGGPLPPNQLDSWLIIRKDGTITVLTGKVELGTGVSTSLRQIVADELDCAFEKIHWVQGDTANTVDQAPTFGSQTIKRGGGQLRQAAAEAKATLLSLASARLGAPVETLTVNHGVISAGANGKSKMTYAELLGGSVDATVVSSPFEYRAEQKGFKTLLSVKETAEFVRIPIAGLSTTQRKIDREPDEIVRFLRALRNAILFLQNQREVGVGLLEKLLKLDRPAAERFYATYRDQYNPELTVTDAVAEEWIAVGTFRAKEKITAKPSVVCDWSFAERARR